MQSCKKPAPSQNEPTSGAGTLADSGIRALPQEAREVLKALRSGAAKLGKGKSQIEPSAKPQIAAVAAVEAVEEPKNCRVRAVTYEVCPKMLEAHMTLVHQVVAPIARRVPANVQRADLFAAGVFGLVDSLRKNGGDSGTTFEWYARTRIRGAVLDELRAQDWLKRRARDAVNAAQRDEGEAETVLFIGLDELSAIDEEEYLASCETNPAAAYEAKETGQILARALDKLPERERKVIGMYYFEDAKYKAIGTKLGISEARVFQLHARALGRLKNAFRAMPDYRTAVRDVRRDVIEPESPTDVQDAHDAQDAHDDWDDVFPRNASSADVA